MGGARKPARVTLSLRAAAPPVPEGAAEGDAAEAYVATQLGDAQREFIRGAAGHPTAPQGAARRRGVKRWTDGTEARKHSIYLSLPVSDALLEAAKASPSISAAIEEAVVAWLEARGRRPR